jgi:nitronate monooxygenase
MGGSGAKMTNPTLTLGKHTPVFPLIQGGMGVMISGPRLAGAAAKAGGIGTIASVGVACASPHYNGRNYFEANRLALRDALRDARRIAPEGILAVNCMVALTDYETHIQAACEGGTDVIISGAGLPLKLPELTRDFPQVALVPIVSSTRAAQLVLRKWEKSYGRLPDGFVVETPLHAGGHLGATKMEHVTAREFSLEEVVPELVAYLEEEVKADIPVIAAGGIWNREDMQHAFALGARGVQMGTRFACTEECDAADRFKQAYLDAKDEDVVVIMSPVGIPGRAIKNPFVAKYLEGDVTSKPCIANCLSHCSYKKDRKAFCIAQALVDAYRGDWEEGLFFCGDNVSRCSSIETVEGIFRELFGDA